MSAIAKLIAGIGLNTTEFKKGIGEVKGETSNLASAGFGKLKTAIAGAFTVGAVVSFIGKLKEYAGAVQDAAEATGSGTSAVQALNAAAIDNASSAEKMKAGLDKIRMAQLDALDGNETMRAAFEKLGISMEQIEQVGADRVFEIIGQSINGAENQATALSAAGDILGDKLITNLTPALKAVGAEGLDPLTGRMKESGRVMDEAMIAKIDLLSDKWESLKTMILVGSANMVNFFERLGAAAWTLFNPSGTETAWEAWDRVAQKQIAAQEAAVKAAKSANASIIQAEQEKIEWVDDGIDYLARHREKAAKEAAAAEIEAARKAADEQRKYLDELAKAQSAYYKAFTQSKWDAMSSEEQLQALEEERLGILAGIRTMEAELSAEQLQNSVLYFQLKTKEWEITGDIEQRTRDLGKTYKDENANSLKFSKDEIKSLGDLKDMLAGMTDDELNKFLKIVKKIHAAVGDLDFSGLMGLMALQGFKIPNESVQNAEQFGKALKVMAGAMGNLKLPDLAPLEVLKGFKIPNESVMNARQFGNAIAELVKALNNTPLDLDPLQKVADLFTALKCGTIQLQIAAPPQNQLQLSMPSGMETRLSSIDGHLATLAGLKGIIYQ